MDKRQRIDAISPEQQLAHPFGNLLRGAFPFWLTLRARQLGYLPLELCDRLRGRSSPLRPPRWLRSLVGDGDFDTVGQRFLNHFRDLAALQPDGAVLDVGCGSGRLALPLTGYLTEPGSYHGFDLIRPAIRWCLRHVTRAFPHFRFTHADVRHTLYNPGGRWPARDYTFPYPERAFDLVVVASVFTHLLPEEVRHYLQEVCRVLKPGGRCLATFFLLNADSLARMAAPGSRFHFQEGAGGYWTRTPGKPEAAVAYREEDVGAFLEGAGLEVCEPIHYGSWCGREQARDGQDLVLFRRSDNQGKRRL